MTERGEYYRRNRNFQAARVDWQNALELSPVETTAALHLARLLALGPPDVQDPNRSRALAQEFKAQGSTDPVWDVLLGMANLRLGEKTGAKELLSATGADEWQTLIAYFRVLDYDLHSEKELARRCFADAVERHHRQLSSMADYQAEELDRLRAEIELLFQSDAVPNP
jgi:hypothetical protein